MAKILGKAARVVDAKATGTFILVEMLTAQEASGSSLIINDNAKVAPQAYIVSIGPALEADKWGIKVGDRVLLQGNYVPLPKITNRPGSRELGIVQSHDIKCVLQEECDD